MSFYPQDGWTALHAAAQEGKIDMVRLLTEAQAQVNIQTEVHTYTMSSLISHMTMDWYFVTMHAFVIM